MTHAPKPKKTLRLTPDAKKVLRELGRMGGQARAAKMTVDERRESALKASKAAAKARTRKAKERQQA